MLNWRRIGGFIKDDVLHHLHPTFKIQDPPRNTENSPSIQPLATRATQLVKSLGRSPGYHEGTVVRHPNLGTGVFTEALSSACFC